MSGGAAPHPEVVVRDLAGMEEYRTAVDFQNETWGPGFTEAVPASMQKVTQRVGGVVAGAFGPGGEMVGFVYGITGVEGGELLHWSDILAVREGDRDLGIGRRLKWHQRARVLALGVRVMRWTFDPLESRNAYLNLERLGTVADEYVRDMYGVSASPLHRGIGTDRLVVRWDLEASRVRRALAEPRAASDPPPGTGGLRDAFAVSGETPSGPVRLPADGEPIALPIPARIQSLRDRDPELARRWRALTREALEGALEAGYEVTRLERSTPTLSRYRLDPQPS